VKPFSIILSLILALSALSFVVWLGKYGGQTSTKSPEKQAPAPTVDDLPMPKSGPFGKAEVSELEFNFGVKNIGDEDKHVFTIKNIGEGPLEFKLGKPTCQCTVGEITRPSGEVATEGPIAPGDSINILVKWVMKSKLDKFRQTVPVFTTDSENRKIEFVITGDVDMPLYISPDGPWELGLLSSTEPSKAEGYFSSRVFDEFTITEVPRENGRVKVTWTPITQSEMDQHGVKSGYLLKAEVGPDVPIGPFREIVRFKALTAKGEIPAELTVSGRRSGPIEVRGVVGANFNIESNRIFFGEFPASSGKKAKVTFIVRDFDEDLVLKSVEPASTRVKITFPPTGKVIGKSKSYQVEIEIPPGPPARHRENDAEVLELKLNHPTAPDLRLAVDYNAI
jgi:hypothetical protein